MFGDLCPGDYGMSRELRGENYQYTLPVERERYGLEQL